MAKWLKIYWEVAKLTAQWMAGRVADDQIGPEIDRLHQMTCRGGCGRECCQAKINEETP